MCHAAGELTERLHLLPLGEPLLALLAFQHDRDQIGHGRHHADVVMGEALHLA